LGLALILLAAAGAAGAQGVTPTTILLGQSVPLSGSNKGLGDDIRNGALAYFKKVNDAGGVNGRKIELLSLDDGNDVKRSGENARKLLEENSVLALFGYASATLSRPALPFVEKNRAPFLAPFTGADPMRVFNKYVYNMRASYADELEKIVDHYTRFGIKRFAIVHYDDVVGKENYAAVDRALKQRNLSPVSAAAFKDRAKPDIETGVKDVLKGDPDVIILTTLYKATSDFVKMARKAGSNAQMVSNSFPGSTSLAKELGKDGVGVVIAQVVPSPTFTAIPVLPEYRAAIEKLLGAQEYSFTSLESFIAAKVVVEAIRRAGTNLTRDTLMAALDNMSSYDAGGYVVSFSAKNHNGSKFVDLTMIGTDLKFKN
jgi:ABC-type branched-subunit amino acid transport system substrate-binding protein